MEEKFWKVCELEDEVPSFIEYSVSAVPEIWIVRLEDGSYICYWPKKNPSKSIRTFANPKKGGSWTTHKCRILMDGEKYSRYEDARQAEKLAQNVSSVLDTTEQLNSTMNFDVLDENEDQLGNSESSELNALLECQSTMQFDVSEIDAEENDDEISLIGNDSADFNKAMLMDGRYCSKKTIVDSGAIQKNCEPANDFSNDVGWLESKSPEKWSYDDSINSSGSEVSTYSQRFSLNNDILTSTAIEDTNGFKNADIELVLSKIEEFGVNVMSLYQDIKQTLDGIKEHLHGNGETINRNEDPKMQSYVPLLKHNQAVNDITFVAEELEENPNEASQTIQATYQTGQSVVIVGYQIGDKSPDHINENEGSIETADDLMIIDDEVQEKTPPVYDQDSLVQMPVDIIIGDELREKTTPDYGCDAENFGGKNSNGNSEDQTDETFDVESLKQLTMKMNEMKDFRNNDEVLLELDEEAVKTLTADLQPLPREALTDYMNRTVDIVFSPNFFLDHITWKGEKGRICMKHTNLLKCWKAAFVPTYGPDEKEKLIMAHFRRLKSAKRAALNTATKKVAKRPAAKAPKASDLRAKKAKTQNKQHDSM